MFLARKITRSKWGDPLPAVAAQIPADAVTADLRTQGNSLSFWKCGGGTEKEVEDAVLALASAWERIDKIEIVLIAEDKLTSSGNKLRCKAGNTPVTDLRGQHVDVYCLNHERLGEIALCIVKAIIAGQYKRLTRKKVTDVLITAVDGQRVELQALADRVRDEIVTATTSRGY